MASRQQCRLLRAASAHDKLSPGLHPRADVELQADAGRSVHYRVSSSKVRGLLGLQIAQGSGDVEAQGQVMIHAGGLQGSMHQAMRGDNDRERDV